MKIKNYIKCLSLLLSFLWISDLPAQNGWEIMADMPQATGYYGSCIDSDAEKAYFFGGGAPPHISTTQIYDFNTDTWSLGADMSNASSSSSAEMVNGKIYLTGEHLSPVALTNVKEYDPVKDTFLIKGPLPAIFYSHGSCVYNGLIYSFGGRDADFNQINTVRTYDPLTDTWSELAEMPYKRDKSAVCIYEDEIYLFGDNPSLKYTPSADSWTELNTGTCLVVAYAVPIIEGNRILLFGGYKSGGSFPNPSNEIWAYYPAQDTMIELGTMPFNRFCDGYKYKNYVYLFGGYFNNTISSVTDEVWRFDLNHVAIEENEYVFSENFILDKIYPNPASGIVNCQLSIVDCQRVSLKIYDLFGREVATVVDEVMPAGEHILQFDTSGLPSGVYLYRLMSVGQLDNWTVGKLVKF